MNEVQLVKLVITRSIMAKPRILPKVTRSRHTAHTTVNAAAESKSESAETLVLGAVLSGRFLKVQCTGFNSGNCKVWA